MELWDVYDSSRNKKNKTMLRGAPFEKDDYHLVVHVCIFNTNGEMLIQQRQSFKEGWPDKWDITAGGSAVQGDTSQTAAQRELMEEIGFDWDFKDLRPHFTVQYPDGFDDVYLIQTELDIDRLTLQYEEVQRVKWATMEEIFSLIEKDEFIPYYKSLIHLFFDTYGQYGCHLIR